RYFHVTGVQTCALPIYPVLEPGRVRVREGDQTDTVKLLQVGPGDRAPGDPPPHVLRNEWALGRSRTLSSRGRRDAHHRPAPSKGEELLSQDRKSTRLN